MANKYFDKLNHISRDSHVKLCPASHEDLERLIAMYKISNYSNTFTLSLRLRSCISPFEETHGVNTLEIRYLRDLRYFDIQHSPRSSLFQLCHTIPWSRKVTQTKMRDTLQNNIAWLLVKGQCKSFKMVFTSSSETVN